MIPQTSQSPQVGERKDIAIVDELAIETESAVGSKSRKMIRGKIGFVRERILSIFEEDEPSWSICCNISIKKKTLVHTLGKFLLFICMIGYITYQLIKYFDTTQNRQEYVDITKVNTMQLPFVYIAYVERATISQSAVPCNTSYVFYNTTTNTDIYYQERDDINVTDWSIDELFDYIDSDDNNCQSIFFKNYFSWYTEILFIPSECDEITVGSRDMLQYIMECNEGDEPYSFIFYQISGKRDQLYEYNTLSNTLDELFNQAMFRFFGNSITVTYNWFSFENTVDTNTDDNDDDDTNNNEYDYYDSIIDDTYILKDPDNAFSWFKNNKTYTLMSYLPNESGIKTTFITEPSMDLFDIIGLSGGVFSSLNAVLTYITVLLIWGISFGKFKINGIAHESGPDGATRRQLEAFLKARDETIVELTQQLSQFQERLSECENNNNKSQDNDFSDGNINKPTSSTSLNL